MGRNELRVMRKPVPCFRLVGSLAVVTASVVLLCSCWERSAQDPLDLGFDGDRLVIVNCGDDLPNLNDILIDEFDGEAITVILDAEGGPELPEGAMLPITSTMWISPGEEHVPTLRPDNRIDVVMNTPVESVTARWVIPQEGLPAGTWISSTGAVAGEPCM